MEVETAVVGASAVEMGCLPAEGGVMGEKGEEEEAEREKMKVQGKMERGEEGRRGLLFEEPLWASLKQKRSMLKKIITKAVTNAPMCPKFKNVQVFPKT